MTNPSTTAIASSRNSAGLKFDPPAFFANKDRVVRWSLAAVVVSGISNLLVLAVILHLANQPPWFVTLDASGRPWSGVGTRFADARKVHTEQSVEAATALLYRTRNEADFPELLPELFSPAAAETAKKLLAEEAPEFLEKAITQKAYIARVEALETRPDLVRIAVSGKLARNGVFHKQPFTEVIPFVLHLTFRFNPDLLRSGRFPTIVQDFQIKYEKAE